LIYIFVLKVIKGQTMKKIMIGVLALGVVVVGGLFFVWSNLDGIVKDAIQTYGSQATKTQVSVAAVKLELESGKASIRGLNVGNPSGFTDPNIFELGEISVNVDVATINQNPIVIDEILIKAPVVVYEINKAGTSNVDMLKKNLGLAGKESSSSSSEDDKDDADGIKMIIRKLVVEGTTAKVRIAALGDVEKTVTLPKILMTDVGKKSGGATAAEVAQLLSSKLITNVKGSVAKIGVNQYLGKSADMFKKGALDKIGNLGGGSGDSSAPAADAIKGLFGK